MTGSLERALRSAFDRAWDWLCVGVIVWTTFLPPWPRRKASRHIDAPFPTPIPRGWPNGRCACLDCQKAAGVVHTCTLRSDSWPTIWSDCTCAPSGRGDGRHRHPDTDPVDLVLIIGSIVTFFGLIILGILGWWWS